MAKFHLLLDDDVILKSSDYLFAMQLSRQCYIDTGIAPARLGIYDHNGNLCPNSSGSI